MRIALVALAVLLAGCAQDAPPGDADVPGPSASPGGEVGDAPRTSDPAGGNRTTELANFTFNQTFPLRVITGATGSTGVGENGGNCVIFPTGIVVGRGEATLSWDGAFPSDLTLEVRVEGSNTPLSEVGGSPVRLAFESLPEASSHPFDWGTFFMVHAGTVPVAVADVELRIAFTYQAKAPLEVQADNAACG